MLHNPLSDLGEKIFLDRYALKDQQRKDMRKGDKIIVCIDPKTGQREVGYVQEILSGDSVRIQLKDGAVIEQKKEHIDKPVETEPEQMIRRVAKGIASVEATEIKRREWTKNFEWLLNEWKFVPGGRILAAAGTDQQLTCYNCYVIPSPHDSRRGIIDTLFQMTEIMSRGGGVGINISSLRPKRSYVKGVNGRSSGAVSWGALYSFVTGLIEQGGSRRGALMLIMDDWHPDLLEFITVKEEMGKITNANLSIGISDAFMKAVEEDKDWEFKFPDTQDPEYDELWDGNLANWISKGKKLNVYKKFKAREIWQQIIKSAWGSAEPGLWFRERTNRMSNSWYFAPLIATNPCGEQPLPAWAVCNLSHINLSRFANEISTDVDWEKLKKTIHYAVRFADNVIDATMYFFEENEKQQKSERRVGIGTIGLAELLIQLGLRYGSDESIRFMDKLYQFIAVESYTMSSQIAEEKGAFPKLNTEKFLQSGFMKSMPEDIRTLVREKGIRNVTLNTQAPTGTVATMVGTATGIEPFYSWTYFRKSRLGTHKEQVQIVKDWQKKHPSKQLPAYFVNAMNLAPEDHAKVQAAIQRWVDSSISKTSNLPNHYTEKQVGEFYQLLYKLRCKGGTVYRDGSRNEQVLMLKKDAPSEKKAKVTEQQPRYITPRKRPHKMHGATYKIETGYGSLFITINHDDQGEPFEVFATIGKTGGFYAAKSEAICRLISVALRSGIAPQVIIDQIKGIRGPLPYWRKEGMVLSIPDAIAQILEEDLTQHKQLQMQLTTNVNVPKTTASEEQSQKSSAVPQQRQANTFSETFVSFGENITLPEQTQVKKVTPAFAAASQIQVQTKTSLADLGIAPQCPLCGQILAFVEGCTTCGSCGYSKCA